MNTHRFRLSPRMEPAYVAAAIANSNARQRGYFPLHVCMVPAIRRSFLDLGAHGRVPFLLAA